MGEPSIKAIETKYKGYRFRSRLEARWAVFFDTLGVEYEYEKEGFELGDGSWYLPDFWLPRERLWIEIKGDFATPEQKRKLIQLAVAGKWFVGLLEGPVECPANASMITVQGGVYRDVVLVQRALWAQCLRCGSLGFLSFPVADEDNDPYMPKGRAFLEDCIKHGQKFICFDQECYAGARQRVRIHKANIAETPLLKAAYTAARSARFEHGEQG